MENNATSAPLHFRVGRNLRKKMCKSFKLSHDISDEDLLKFIYGLTYTDLYVAAYIGPESILEILEIIIRNGKTIKIGEYPVIKDKVDGMVIILTALGYTIGKPNAQGQRA